MTCTWMVQVEGGPSEQFSTSGSVLDMRKVNGFRGTALAPWLSFVQTQKAGAVAGLLLLLGSLLIVPIRIFSWPAAVVYPLMLFSPVSFAVAISAIVKGEGAAMGSPYQGLNWQTLWSTVIMPPRPPPLLLPLPTIASWGVAHAAGARRDH